MNISNISSAPRASVGGMIVADAFGRVNELAPMRADALCSLLTERAAFYRMPLPEVVRSPRGLRPRGIVRALRRNHCTFAQVALADVLGVVM